MAEQWRVVANYLAIVGLRQCIVEIMKKLLSSSSDGIVRLFKIGGIQDLEVAALKTFREKQCIIL